MNIHFEGAAEEVKKEMAAFLGTLAPAEPASKPKKEKESAPSAPAETKVEEKKDTASVEDQIKTEIGAACSRAGKPKVIALLAEYGVKKGSELPEDKKTEFLVKVKALEK